MNLDFNNVNLDKNYEEGMKEYDRVITLAQKYSEEISNSLLDEIIRQHDDENIKEEDKISLQTALLACSRAMVNLCAAVYDNEQEFRDDIVLCRKKAPIVIQAATHMKPCGKCEACLSGHDESCLKPVFGSEDEIDTEIMASRRVPILVDEIMEFDIWNKIIYLYTQGREFLNNDNDGDVAAPVSEDVASK